MQSYPAVAFNGENYVVVWSDKSFGSSHCYIGAARVNTSGVVLDPGVCITTGTGDDEKPAKIAFDGSRCLVVWKKAGEVSAVFLNAQCQTEGSIFQVASSVIGGPCLAFDRTNYLVVWLTSNSPDFILKGQFVSTSGNLVGNDFTIAVDTVAFAAPELIFDSTNYFVVWSQPFASDPLINGQFVATDGSLIGSTFTISNVGTNYRREDPAVAASDGNYLVTWDEYRASLTSDLYGNVDVDLSGIETDDAARDFSLSYTGTTILSGSLVLPKNRNCKVFDITGRVVMRDKIKPGIYFIEIEGKITGKVVKVR